jgi:hypothetical protein
MSYLPRTRVIEGKRYSLHDDYLKRDDAKWNATKLKGKGYRVRTIRLMGLYGLYKRKGK